MPRSKRGKPKAKLEAGAEPEDWLYLQSKETGSNIGFPRAHWHWDISTARYALLAPFSALAFACTSAAEDEVIVVGHYFTITGHSCFVLAGNDTVRVQTRNRFDRLLNELPSYISRHPLELEADILDFVWQKWQDRIFRENRVTRVLSKLRRLQSLFASINLSILGELYSAIASITSTARDVFASAQSNKALHASESRRLCRAFSGLDELCTGPNRSALINLLELLDLPTPGFSRLEIARLFLSVQRPISLRPLLVTILDQKIPLKDRS